jgi:aryl-phospho-beta-D-glucosidase BglC (GH1 family)
MMNSNNYNKILSQFAKPIFFLLIYVCSINSIIGAQGFLHTSGSKIVNGNGVEIILRGIGLGGWLVPEGYMLHTAGFANSPTEIRNKITALVGPKNADQFFQSYRQNYVTRKDIDSIAGWGFNSIRLPMHYELLTPKGKIGSYLESGFALIDSLLSWCEANHLYLILDLHCAPGGQNSANISDYNSADSSLWQSALYRQQTLDLWKEIARRYVNRSWIGGYDLLNETVWDFGSGSNNKPLKDLYIAITDSIRTIDKNHIVFIEGNQWANDFTGLASPWDNNMVYSFHKYWNANDQNSISWVINLRNSTNVPLWCGESGENSNQWFADCIALFEANKIGWSWWPHKKIESTATLLSSSMTVGYSNLLQYWNNPVSQPSVQDAMNALNSQVTNLNIEQCSVRRDVIDALFRQPFTMATVPFSNNKIPGYIFATEYDMGKNGYAYIDKDYQNTGGTSGGTWNTGGLYRNDGVDIERCSDFPTDGYDVGWINNGEFLNFTVNVTESATYDVNVRYAANAAGGMLRLQLDGNYISGILTLQSTGGWQTWSSFSAGQYSLTSGTHQFGISFLAGGFNLNYLNFTKTVTQVIVHDQPVSDYQLQQNYPNPFNPTTVISYQLPTKSSVVLKVYDVLGREVMQSVNEQQEAGYHQTILDARCLASGLYMYRLIATDEQNNQHTFQKKMLLLK